MKITVEDGPSGHHPFSNVKLVRGVGKRSVRVTLRCFPWPPNEDEIAVEAARIASRNGWRRVIVAYDSYEGDTIRAFNFHQYHYEEWQKGFIGAFLGFKEQ